MSKVAIVTGGTRGIGRGISSELAENDYQVVALYRSDEVSAQSLEEMHDNVMSLKCDIQDTKQVDFCIDTVMKKFGRIDCLVNNAGITRDGYFLMMSKDKWSDVINVNLNGMFHITKQVLKKMKIKKNGGRIINISSTSGVSGQAGQANYSASKGAIISLTKTLSKECAKDQVTVNCVSPGFINTDMTKDLADKEVLQNQLIPLNRFGEVEEVAYLVAFLASEKAAYITGKNIVIDGGMIND